MAPLRVAVGFLAFDRCHLVRLALERVLATLPEGWALRVWQDGAVERKSGRLVANPRQIERNLALFERLGGDVDYPSEINRATAEIYWAAEHWAFETVGADIAIFVEDDLVISPHFFAMMAQLGRIALGDARVGAFSAYGSSALHCVKQMWYRQRLQPMHHRWGYGITGDYWRRNKADYLNYLEVLDGCDYRARPNAAISAWIDGLGGAGAVREITGQDGARTAIMLKLGCFSIMTMPSYAVNIGKSGLHCTPQFYQGNRWQMKGRHAMFPWQIKLPARLSDAEAERLAAESRDLRYW